MSSIRPLEREALPQAARLVERLLGSGARTPRPGLVAFLERALLDHPWADEEIPSLVHADARGRITGLIGSQVRRMRFAGRPIRVTYSSHFVADPDVPRPIGPALLRHFIAGPQDLTITDSAIEPVPAMWERLGGDTVHASCLSWIRVFRPARSAALWIARRRRSAGRQRLPLATRALCAALDSIPASWPGSVLRPGPPLGSERPITVDDMLEHLPEIARGKLLHPDYDRAYLEYLFEELGRDLDSGELVASIVEADGRALGWYVYHLDPGGACKVTSVAGSDQDLGSVLDRLFGDAHSRGAASLQGRVEPGLIEPLSRRPCLLRPSMRMVIHSRDPELAHAVVSGRALLTRLEGEWVGLG